MIKPGDGKADDAAFEQRHAGIFHARQRTEPDQPVDHGGDADQRQHAGGDQALVQRAHDGLAGAELDEERAGNRRENADAADRQRQRHHVHQQWRCRKEDRGQHHGGDRGHCIGLEQVGRHAGAIADVVTDVVGDGGRVARIVFGNAGFDLADQIAADVGALGEDAAAKPREDRDQRCAEAQRHQRIDNGAAVSGKTEVMRQICEVDGDAEQREPRYQHAGDGTSLERKLKSAGQRRRRRLRGTHVSADRNVHADEAGSTRQHRADQEAKSDESAEEIIKQREDHDADHADGHVLTFEIGLRALAHRGRDLLHARIARVRL